MFELLREIWGKDISQYPAPSPMPGWIGFWLRVKCSICIVLRRCGPAHEGYEAAPVYVGPLWVNYANPSASWQEIAVAVPWRQWRYYVYTNGI